MLERRSSLYAKVYVRILRDWDIRRPTSLLFTIIDSSLLEMDEFQFLIPDYNVCSVDRDSDI